MSVFLLCIKTKNAGSNFNNEITLFYLLHKDLCSIYYYLLLYILNKTVYSVDLWRFILWPTTVLILQLKTIRIWITIISQFCNKRGKKAHLLEFDERSHETWIKRRTTAWISGKISCVVLLTILRNSSEQIFFPTFLPYLSIMNTVSPGFMCYLTSWTSRTQQLIVQINSVDSRPAWNNQQEGS